jgi:hypothetical protein
MKTKTKKINTTLLYVALIATTFFWTAISVLAAEKESSQKN